MNLPPHTPPEPRDSADTAAAINSADRSTDAGGFPIVGVGASAGGLEAYRRLLEALPADTGMGFVLIQHLAPEHQSMLPEILARSTSMPVTEVHDEPRVERNHVYVIPPNRSMLMSGGHLKLVPRTDTFGQHRSVDTFLRSLADDQHHHAIGVILSGTGSDGTLGLEAIKAEGGVTFAQDESAQQDGMPRSAVAADSVDYVLSPEKIAEELARISRHPYVGERNPRERGPDEIPYEVSTESDLNKILRLLHEVTGVDFTLYKSTTLFRRVTRRMLLHQLDGLLEYYRRLRQDPVEVQALYHDILISVTAFFRDPACFEAIKGKLLPLLMADRPRTHPLRVWVLGCSTGEEAYSLAMVIAEYAAEKGTAIPVNVFATDLNEQGIEKARTGVYPKSIAHDVSPERLRRFFVDAGDSYQVSKAIREMCVFARQNVASDPPFSRMDLISCRNLLIYMEPTLQKRVVPMLHYALKPGGFLWLGMSETAGNFGELFEQFEPKYKIFVKKQASVIVPATIPQPVAAWAPREFGQQRRRASETVVTDMQREVDRVLLARYAPPGVLLNADLEVLQFRGDTSPFLSQAPGKPSLNVLKMAREGLLVGLRGGLQEAITRGTRVREERLLVKTDGGFRDVNLEILPIRGDAAEQRCFLVLFEDAAQAKLAPSPGPPAEPPVAAQAAEQQVARLTQELAATREYMQSLVEQKEAANEEMQSANEEIQSANEELQSVNEELQTSKEEIQSSNEELTTVNDELRHRNEQLDRAHNDLSNVVASSQVAMVVVGVDLRIRRFTPMAEKLLNLICADVGRPIGDLKFPLGLPDLETRLAEVIDTIKHQEQEVQDRQGRWYSLRLFPYKTFENKIDGAIIVLVDIEEQKRTQLELRASEEKHRLLVEGATGVALMLLDQEGRVTGWNLGAERIFGYTEAEVTGENFSRFFIPEDQATDLPAQELDQARRLGEGQDDNWLVRKDGTRFWASGMSTLLKEDDGRIRGFSKVVRDQTDQKLAEEALKDSERRYRDLVHSLPAAVYTCDAEGHITLYNQTAVQLWGREPKLGSDLWCGSWRMYKPDGAPLPGEQCPMAIALREGRAIRGEEIVIERPNGSRVNVLPYPEPLFDAAGKIVGAINILVDLTELHRTEQALRESETQLHAALSAAHMGTWLWYLEEDRQVLDDSLYGLFGREPGTIKTLADFVGAIYLDDRAAVHAAFSRSVREGTDLDIEFRVPRPDGGVRWLRDRGKVVSGPGPRCLTGACADTSERREAEQVLREANRRKDEFLATLAHELRNPLAPLRTGLGLLKLAPLDGAVAVKAREMMDRQLSHMVRLIDDLLDVSRITRGIVDLRQERVQVRTVVDIAVEASQPAITAGRHTFTAALPEEPLWLDADPTRMAQVINNLLVNSAKYTPEGGRIELTAERDGDQAVIRVIDTGSGIPAEVLPKVFDMFSQIHQTIDRAQGGLGIGLSLVKHLVEMHGGTVEAASAGLGHGSTFTVRVPLAPAEIAKAPEPPAPAPEAVTPPPEGRRILVVDDNIDAAESLALMLQLTGYETQVAHSGSEALAVGRTFVPEVVILDIGLPDMNGHEVARRFRAEPNLRQAVLIALTGWGSENDKRKSRDAGFDYHFTKPVETAALGEVLAQLPPPPAS